MGGGFQHGGYCRVISAALILTNTELLYKEEMYVMETFGCYAHTPAKQKATDKTRPRGGGVT